MSTHDHGVHNADPEDELESYLAGARHDPVFLAAYEDAEERQSILDRLVGLRRDRHLTQSAIAARMGVRQPTVSGFETEDSDPRLSSLQRYARAVGARLRLVLLVTGDHDWPSASVTFYRSRSSRASMDAPVQHSELPEKWRAEREEQGRQWAASR